MSEQVTFTIGNRNPDVLTCIANLSSDEVFTPPELAREMLDTLANVWADQNRGKNIWADPTLRFLDPAAKSGVFLREITTRLVSGLRDEIPDLRTRVDHILSRQVFGIGITHLTALITRRSLYCSKWADGPHSIARALDSPDGNVWFQRLEHTWSDGRCSYCGASQGQFEREAGLETHAYAIIHTDDVKARIAEVFGENMQFDVIIGNPPYQIDDDGGHRPVPLYQKFVEQAMALDPRYLVMVTPSRWMAGGLGLAAFRGRMLNDGRLRVLVDHPVSREVFPGVEVKGGVSYFLWARDTPGTCAFSTVRDGTRSAPIERELDAYDILVRDSVGVPLLERVLKKQEPSFESIVASVRPFGDKLRSNFVDYKDKKTAAYDTPLLVNERGRRRDVWTKPAYLTANLALAKGWKIFLPKAGSDGGQRLPNPVIGTPQIGAPGQISTETYLAIGPFRTKREAQVALSYLETQFARYLISLRKISQDNVPSTFRWLPIPDLSKPVTEATVRRHYKVTADEAAHIDRMVSVWADVDE